MKSLFSVWIICTGCLGASSVHLLDISFRACCSIKKKIERSLWITVFVYWNKSSRTFTDAILKRSQRLFFQRLWHEDHQGLVSFRKFLRGRLVLVRMRVPIHEPHDIRQLIVSFAVAYSRVGCERIHRDEHVAKTSDISSKWRWLWPW